MLPQGIEPVLDHPSTLARLQSAKRPKSWPWHAWMPGCLDDWCVFRHQKWFDAWAILEYTSNIRPTWPFHKENGDQFAYISYKYNLIRATYPVGASEPTKKFHTAATGHWLKKTKSGLWWGMKFTFTGLRVFSRRNYSLVNIQKTIWKITTFNGKISTISTGPFSIAFCKFTKGYMFLLFTAKRKDQQYMRWCLQFWPIRDSWKM